MIVLANWHLYCHLDRGGTLPKLRRIVWKVGSYATWKAGDTSPVVRLRTRPIDLACCGDGPMYTPTRARSAHLSICLPEARFLSSSYAGHPK